MGRKPFMLCRFCYLKMEMWGDAQGKRYLETSYRYLMSYNYQVMKDNKAALECAQKILEIKPDDEGIKQVIETLSKAVK